MFTLALGALLSSVVIGFVIAAQPRDRSVVHFLQLVSGLTYMTLAVVVVLH